MAASGLEVWKDMFGGGDEKESRICREDVLFKSMSRAWRLLALFCV